MTTVRIPCPFCDGRMETPEGYVCTHCMGLGVVRVNAPERREDSFALSIPLAPMEYADEPPSRPITEDAIDG